MTRVAFLEGLPLSEHLVRANASISGRLASDAWAVSDGSFPALDSSVIRALRGCGRGSVASSEGSVMMVPSNSNCDEGGMTWLMATSVR